MIARRLRVVFAIALVVSPLAACQPNPPPACGDLAPPRFSVGEAEGGSCEPPPECEDCASVHGDPHVTTHDGRHYDLMTVGEFVGAHGTETEVHLRFAPFGDSRSVSVLSGVAIDLDGVAVSAIKDVADPAAAMAIVINGESVDLAEQPYVNGDRRAEFTDEGELIIVRGEDLLAVVSESSNHLDLAIRFTDDVRGVLGSNDGDPANDLTTRDGTDLGTPGHDVIHEDFADSWRITDDESLFDYGDGESTETFTDLDFPHAPLTLDDLSSEDRAAAEAICRAARVTDPEFLDGCILDVAVTDDPSFAESAAAMQRRLARDGVAPPQGTVPPPHDNPVTGTGAEWVTTIEGISGGQQQPVVRDDDRLHVLGLDDERVGHLVALDADTGAEQWRVPGVETRCGVGVLGDGRIVVVGQEGGPLASDEAGSIVVLEADTGAVVSSAAWDVAASTYCGPMVVAGDVVVVPESIGAMRAWNVADTPTEAWAIRDVPKMRAQIVVVGDRIVASRGVVGADKDREMYALDAADGTEVASVDIRGAGASDSAHIVAVDGGVVIATLDDVDDEERPGTVTRVALDGDEFTVEWELAGLLDHVTTDGDVVVGHSGGDLVSIDVATGDERWRVDPPGFRNTKSPAVLLEGQVYDGVFGGPYLLEVSDTGEVVREITGTDVFDGDEIATAGWFGPAYDGLVVTQSTSAEGRLTVVAFATG